MKLSIVIPAHNEEKRIPRTLEDYCSFFSRIYKKNFEIIVVLNGCTDNTLEVVKKFKKKYLQIKYLNFEQAGKGFAIIEGFKVAKGDLIGFTDADDATNAVEFYNLIKNIDDFDGIIASRWMKESIVYPRQSLIRQILGRIFNLLINLMFHLNYKDTQCGAKLFKKNSILKILPNLGITEWAFDIDLLYNFKINGFKVIEVPIKWCDVSGSKINFIKSSMQMFVAISRLRMIHSPLSFIVRFYDLLPEKIKLKKLLR